MSHVESHQRAYEAFVSGDIETAFADLSDDAVFHGQSPSIPAGGTYSGKQEILETWLPELGQTLQNLTLSPKEWIDAGDHVIVLGSSTATVNGTDVESTFCHVWHWDGDQIAEAHFFGDSALVYNALNG